MEVKQLCVSQFLDVILNKTSLVSFQQQMAAAANHSLTSNSNGLTNVAASVVNSYPSIANSNHSPALTNSALSQFELFQRSFQRENMPNALRNGNGSVG